MEAQPLVRDWMTTDPITADVNLPILDAHQLMTKHRIRRLPVMDSGELVGIVTLGDIRGAEPSEATSLSVWELNYLLSRLSVERVMSSPVVTASLGDTIADVARLMMEHKIAGLPILQDSKLVGIITESDIFRMVVRHWEGDPQLATAL